MMEMDWTYKLADNNGMSPLPIWAKNEVYQTAINTEIIAIIVKAKKAFNKVSGFSIFMGRYLTHEFAAVNNSTAMAHKCHDFLRICGHIN